MTFPCQVLLGSLVVALSLGLSSSTDICAQKDQSGFKLNLLGTALFREYLLLITQDDAHNYMVYKVPLGNFDHFYGQMLLDMPGLPIEQYWPMLKDDPTWSAIRGNVISVWLIDKMKPYLYFIVPEGHAGNGLDVNSGKWVGGVESNAHNNIATQHISNADASHTYSNKFNEDVHEVYLLYRWEVTLNDDGQFVSDVYHEESHLYYSENKRTNKMENITFMDNYNHGESIVTPDNDPYLQMSGYENYHLVNLTDWNLSPSFVPPGFIFKGQFHMFSLEKVFIFADRLTYERPKKKLGEIWYSTPIKIVPHKDFFVCDKSKLVTGTYPPEAPPITIGPKGGNRQWLWIFLVILLSLVLVLSGVWLCSHRKKPKGAGRHGSGGSSASSRRKRNTTRSLKKGSLKRSKSQMKRNTALNASLKRHSNSKGSNSTAHRPRLKLKK